MTEERSAGEDSFDMMVEALKNEPASTPCIFSDQMGRGRTTTGMIAACLIKEIQITTELRSSDSLSFISNIFMALPLYPPSYHFCIGQSISETNPASILL